MRETKDAEVVLCCPSPVIIEVLPPPAPPRRRRARGDGDGVATAGVIRRKLSPSLVDVVVRGVAGDALTDLGDGCEYLPSETILFLPRPRLVLVAILFGEGVAVAVVGSGAKLLGCKTSMSSSSLAAAAMVMILWVFNVALPPLSLARFIWWLLTMPK
jgi:hypothetical protein